MPNVLSMQMTKYLMGILHEHREQERFLLSQAATLLMAAEAAPEAEVTAQELAEDAVMAHAVDAGNSFSEACALGCPEWIGTIWQRLS